MGTAPTYPEVRVDFTAQDGNAFAILGTVMAAMRRGGCTQAQVDAFHKEATAGDYDHLLRTVMRTVTVEYGRGTVNGPDRPADLLRGTVVFTTTMPAGEYRLGDPCYSIPDDRWMEWLRAADYIKERHLVADLDGRKIVGLGTAYGDGVYTDQQGREYGVDAGLIGLVPVDLPGIRKDYADGNAAKAAALGVYHTFVFDRPFRVMADDKGGLLFDTVLIDTDPEDEEEDECWSCGEPGCTGWCVDEEED